VKSADRQSVWAKSNFVQLRYFQIAGFAQRFGSAEDLMPLFRITALIVIFASAVSLSVATAPVDQNANTQDNRQEMDRSIQPGDDFYWYANGGWLGTVSIPAGQTSYDTRAILVEKTSQRVRDLIQDAAAAQPIRGSIAQKVGDYYASFMDEDGIEAKGLAPLADEMARISAITNKPSLSAYLFRRVGQPEF
jgi:putative endopeptidase